MIPNNAQAIIDARAKGMKPDEMILISMVGRINEPNHTVYAGAGKAYDMRWLRGLQACIFASSGVDWRGLANLALDAKPAYLALWDVGLSQGAEIYRLPNVNDIEKPRSQWRMKLNYIAWTPEQNWRFKV